MIITPRTIAITLAVVIGAIPALAEEEVAEFHGVEKSMSEKAFKEAGLDKLTPEERARLDEFIRSYVTSKTQEAASVAVEKAVKDNRVSSQPQVIESRILGPFRGYNGRSRFTLENGQVWAQSQQVTRGYPPIDSPPVIIVKGGWGWRMYILGGGDIRVSRVK